MARAKSAVLTPEEKKSVIADVKAKIKSQKDSNKLLSKELVDRSKEHDKAIRAFGAAQKASEKLLSAGFKELLKLEAELAGLTGVKAVATE